MAALRAMGDLKIMGESEAVGVITGAAEAHREANVAGKDKALHREVVRHSRSHSGEWKLNQTPMIGIARPTTTRL